MAYKKVLQLTADKAVKVGGEGAPTQMEGYYIGTKVVPSKQPGYKDSNLHILSTQEGTVGVWGTSNLDPQMRTITPGNMTLIEYLGRGQKQKGKQPAYLYQVHQDADNTLDVSTISLETSSEEGEESEEESHEEQESQKYVSQKTSTPKSQPTNEAQARVAAMLAKRK